jgi:hypothetical protein
MTRWPYHRLSDVSRLRRSPDVWRCFIRHDLAAIWGGRGRLLVLGTGHLLFSLRISPSRGSAPQIAPFQGPRATSGDFERVFGGFALSTPTGVLSPLRGLQGAPTGLLVEQLRHS